MPHAFPLPEEWKTPPLWGVADSAPYFHDGGSRTLEAAIDRHHGDAEVVLEPTSSSRPTEKRRIVAFLRTLKAPAEAKPADPDEPGRSPRPADREADRDPPGGGRAGEPRR